MVINVRIKPNAKKSSIIGFENGYFLISVQDQPIEGRANKAMINLLAKRLKIAKGCIKLKKGAKSKFKRVEVECMEENKIMKLLMGYQSADL